MVKEKPQTKSTIVSLYIPADELDRISVIKNKDESVSFWIKKLIRKELDKYNGG